jgi:hypothetical protein
MKLLTFGKLADLLESRIAQIPVKVREGLYEAGELVAKDARDRIGTYQSVAGPFEAWAPLADATKADRVSQGFSADEPLLRTGELRDAIEVKPLESAVAIGVFGGAIAQIAASTEYGYWNVRAGHPVRPRSFLRAAAFTTLPAAGRLIFSKVVEGLKGV